MKRFELKMEEELYEQLSKNIEDGEMSEFIREAIREKLSRKKIADEKGMEVLDFIQKMDPEAMIRKMVDQELVGQFTYEEIKKQNELLKIIHKRVTLGSKFSAVILDEVTQSRRSTTEQALVETRCTSELNELKF